MVDGNTIRWTDLCMLKDDWESRRFSKSTRIKSERTQSEESESQIFQGTKYKVIICDMVNFQSCLIRYHRF